MSKRHCIKENYPFAETTYNQVKASIALSARIIAKEHTDTQSITYDMACIQTGQVEHIGTSPFTKFGYPRWDRYTTKTWCMNLYGPCALIHVQ